MASVVITSIPEGVPEIWENPSNIGGNVSGIPLSKIVYKANQLTIPVKDAADTTTINITAVLPNNFVYRVFNITAWIEQAAAASALKEFSLAMVGHLVTDVGQFYKFPLTQELLAVGESYTASGGTPPTAIQGLSGDKAKIAYFEMNPRVKDIMIDNSKSGAGVIIDWFDTTNDATAILYLSYRIEVLQYTISALNSWRLNTPLLTSP